MFLDLKAGAKSSQTYKDMTLHPHTYQNVCCDLLQEKTSVYTSGVCNSRFFMLGAILKVTNISFQKGITFCRSIYVKKGMKLVAFIFKHPL